MSKKYDVTIIGGGPAGMFAAFYSGLHELKTQIIEALPDFGGQVGALYPEKQIWDVAGKPGVTGKQLVDDLKRQLQMVTVDKVLGQRVTDVIKKGDGTFTVVTPKQSTQSKTVIIALGNGAFKPRKLALKGADQLEGEQVNYFVHHKDDYRNRRVAVLGGGNTALDMAMMLEPVAKKVYLIHRRDQFRGLEHTVNLLRQSSVKIKTPFLPRDLAVQDDGSIELLLKKMRTKEEEALTVDRILVSYGFTANNAALDEWSLNLAADRHLIKVDETMATSVDGVYAIGDGVTYSGKVPLIATAFGEAPIAVTALAKKLYPDKQMAMHSSSMKMD